VEITTISYSDCVCVDAVHLESNSDENGEVSLARSAGEQIDRLYVPNPIIHHLIKSKRKLNAEIR
jgi:hypothetical protein